MGKRENIGFILTIILVLFVATFFSSINQGITGYQILGGGGSTQLGSQNLQAGGGSKPYPTEGMVGFWNFYGDYSDYSGNGNHAICTGLQCPTLELSGLKGTAFDFGGVNDGLYVIDSSSIDTIISQVSVAAWIYRDTSSSLPQTIIAEERGTGNSNHYHLGLANNQYSFKVQTNSGQVTVTGGAAQLGEWVFVVATYDGTRVKIFINGQETGSADAQSLGSLAIDNNPITIGADINDGSLPLDSEFFNGILDEVAVWNRALSSSEIQGMYQLPRVPTQAGKKCILLQDGGCWDANLADSVKDTILAASLQPITPTETNLLNDLKN